MTRISIDASPKAMELNENQKVGEALAQLLVEIPENRFVSEVEVDGNKIRHYLPETEINKELKSVQELKVHTADRAQWAANGFDIALSSLERIQRTLIVSAGLFRDSQMLEGNRLFARCMDGLERFWDAITMTRSALKLDFKEVSIHSWKLSDLESQFLDIVKGFVVLQDGQHYDALADKVEFELIPHLSRWVEAMEMLRSAQAMDS